MDKEKLIKYSGYDGLGILGGCLGFVLLGIVLDVGIVTLSSCYLFS